jgi:hypothetical protein
LGWLTKQAVGAILLKLGKQLSIPDTQKGFKMKLAIAKDLDQGLYDLKPFRNKYKIVSGPDQFWVGKLVTVSKTKQRTMTRMGGTTGWCYDPKGQDKEYTEAIYWRGRSGWSPGIVVETIEQAREALVNRDKTSVPYYG